MRLGYLLLFGCVLAFAHLIPPKLLATCYPPTIIDMGDGTANIGLISDRTRPGNVPMNPALLAGGGPISVSFSYGNYLVASTSVMISLKGGVASCGLGVYTSHLTGGVINRTTGDDPTGQVSGSFSYNQTAFGIGGGKGLLGWLDLGVGLRVARVDADEYTRTHTFIDLGTIIKMDRILDRFVGWRLNLGFVARGIRAFSSSRCEGTRISDEVCFNATSPGNKSTLAVGWLSNTLGRHEVKGGIILRPSEDFELTLGSRRRVGNLGDRAQGLPWYRGLIAGFGLRFGTYWLNYTYEDASPLEGIHRFMLRACLCD